MNHIDLNNFAGGGLSKRIDAAFDEVARNILDPNTGATKKRSVTVTFTFSPAKSRTISDVDISVRTKLEGPQALSAAMAMGKDLSDGHVEAREIVAHPEIPGQMTMDTTGTPISTGESEVTTGSPEIRTVRKLS